MTTKTTRLGVDIGGTFTDAVLETAGAQYSTKVLTNYEAPEDGIVEAMHRVCADTGIRPESIDQIIHGTTLATNTLIERRGAKTALITTEGFRDVIEMRSESRFEQYDLNLRLPEPLLPRNRRYTIRERMDASGEVLIPLDPADIDALAGELEMAGYESVAVGLLHSYLNDAHERAIAEALATRLPGIKISLSSRVSPQMREYERFNTTIANAYIQPLMASYLGRLRGRLAEEKCSAPIFLVHSGGGIMSLENAAEFPVRLVESGPAGGAIFAADIAAKHGLDKVLSFDMGGTTAKICLIKDQTPKTARVFEVARSYRFKKGSGMPISIPVIDMVEIGAGGGSLAHVDALDQIRVGPESAGSEPGPACYGRGGTRAAVSDADLQLGRLDPENFADGSIPLDPERAGAALQDDIGVPLGLDADGAAWGLSEVVDENMANAARVHAVENGEDLSDYTMIAFGGAAPIHAARLCEKLGIERCLVPEGAGVGSAIGFLRAPFSFEANRSVYMRIDSYDPRLVGQLFAEMETEAIGFVSSCDPDSPVECNYKVYMRYKGQGWEIPVPLPRDPDQIRNGAEVLQRFEAEYRRLFGRVVSGAPAEITVWSVEATTPRAAVSALPPIGLTEPVNATGTRPLFDPERGRFAEAQAILREHFSPGRHADGPAIVTEAQTSVIVPASRHVLALGDGTLDIRTRPEVTDV